MQEGTKSAIPYIPSIQRLSPYYIALYGEPGHNHRINNACAAFYKIRLAYDGVWGIYNAIYRDILGMKAFYHNRFADVQCSVESDYSSYGVEPTIRPAVEGKCSPTKLAKSRFCCT